MVRAVHGLSLASPVQSLCWRKSRDPEPPSRHHCGLSAAKVEKRVSYSVLLLPALPRTFPCAVTTLLPVGGGGGWFSKGPTVATLIYDHEP